MPWLRVCGSNLKRNEGLTQPLLPAFQAPPRMTRSSPLSGPATVAAEAESASRWGETKPCLGRRRGLLGRARSLLGRARSLSGRHFVGSGAPGPFGLRTWRSSPRESVLVTGSCRALLPAERASENSSQSVRIAK
jgi:hypothetical protein